MNHETATGFGADAATALESVRAQREAAAHALELLEAICGLAPRGECLAEWAGFSNHAYVAELASLSSSLVAVRTGLREAIDDLRAVIWEAEDG